MILLDYIKGGLLLIPRDSERPLHAQNTVVIAMDAIKSYTLSGSVSPAET